VTRARLALALVGLAVGAACASSPGAVSFRDDWPESAPRYGDVVEQWTRSSRVLDNFDRVLDVHATFLSPAWRAAYVDERAKREMMGDEARAELANEQRAAMSELYEIELLVSTYLHRENDLHKGERSMWRVVLVDDRGNEVRPIAIERDRRKRSVIKTYFPHMTDFHTPYIARFPRTVDLLRRDARAFSLRIASARGGVELVWENRR